MPSSPSSPLAQHYPPGPSFIADLHIHSRFSMATSRHLFDRATHLIIYIIEGTGNKRSMNEENEEQKVGEVQ